VTAATEILWFVIGLVFGASLYVIARRIGGFLQALEDRDVWEIYFGRRP